MSNPVIEVRGLGKMYDIKRKHKVDNLRELLTNPMGWRTGTRFDHEEFWALRNVTFDVREGETLAVIGRNGAGKSTLLKILAHVVTPTEGTAIIRGKTASLLEVGTGFHQELSGRENVFFNGALLGMSKAEIARKFNEIVEFSEVGHFIDNPVKHYSSGMRARLAFSVAAHLEADVMIIDEALAAGDVAFRKKAQEKMRAAAFEGRSVLFVTHSMGSAIELCDRAIYLKDGQMVMMGETKEVVDAYMGASGGKTVDPQWEAGDTPSAPDARIVARALSLHLNGSPLTRAAIKPTDKLEVSLTVDIPKPSEAMSIGVSLFDDGGRRLFRAAHTDAAKDKRLELKAGRNTMTAELPLTGLKEGDYSVAIDCDIYKDAWEINPASTPARVGFTLGQNNLLSSWDPKRDGILRPKIDWRSGE